MKNFYILLTAILFSFATFAQGYEFGIVHNTDYNFSVVAIPDFDGTDTDISDVGLGLMLPAGNADVANLSQFSGRTWTATEVDAAQLTGLGLGDGTQDLFVLNMPPGQTILSHTNGEQIVLVSFDVTNMPATGEMSILPNADPIATGLGGVADSFYNSNIDMTTTQNYFSGLAAGLESFMFETLSIEDNVLDDNAIKVFPNPTSDYILIKTTKPITQVRVVDINGKLHLRLDGPITEVNVRHLSSGIYFLQLELNNVVAIKRIIRN